MPVRDRELVTPAPSLSSLQEISGPALVAMLLATAIVVIDAVVGGPLVFIGLLAIPPVIAAMSASLPETAVVAVFCIVLALLSPLWGGIDEGQRWVSSAVVLAGAACGIWVADLRARLNRETAASELLAEAGALMEDALNQRERAEHLAELAVPSLGDVALVDMITPEGVIERMAAQSRGSEVADVMVRLRRDAPIDPHGPHPVAEVIRTGETKYLDQLSDAQIDEIAPRENERKTLRRYRFRSCVVLPLGARGAVLGALTLWIMRPAKAFDETARRTAQRLADRAGLALDNARLHEQQSHIAAVLQHSLLPRSLPQITGFEVSSRFLAAGEAYEVGGDFYDVFPSGSRTWSAVIGDVCGKGPEAASLTALARYTVRTASSPDRSPSDVLRALHDSINSERDDFRFCTAALARIQAPANGNGEARVTVALGGHPLPIILRQNGQVQSIGEPGTILGVLPSPTLADVEDTLGVGDSLILYTDGVLDIANRAKRGDPDWFKDQVAVSTGKSADEIAERLAKAAIERHGSELRDDIAILVLRNGNG
ncbi:MAG TPA: GAF domain-containing SpoIIE family protein phosphatase [Solirubrobacterales bacterium]|nr:GAF domain-containing SpoIIE family protein phosphatase [Solirubrobacterales bacterium]